jgi:hypothetical protein
MNDEVFEDDQAGPIDLDCIDACTGCAQTCLDAALNHCLERGGEHVAPPHFRLMMDCAEICQLSARLQLGSSEFAEEFCALCAQVCLACADSCDALEGMDDCAQACRDCARSCETMSGMAS